LRDTYTFERANQILNNFINDKLTSYSSKRNFDFGSYDDNFTSGLSPFISRKILTEQFIVEKILQSLSFNSVEKYIQEICWRTYWKGYLEHRPKIWYNYLKEIELFAFKKEHPKYKNAISGQTGIDCFDSWTKELKQNNYLHNHTRMWFASIWIHTLNLPWQLGAEYFLEELYDADPASNTLSWRWVAGLHTQNKVYLANAENIKKYTGGKFYPKDQLSIESIPNSWEYFEPENISFTTYQQPEQVKCLLMHENNLSLQDIPKFEYIFIQQRSLQSIKRSNNVSNYIDKALFSFKEKVRKNCAGKVILFTFENFQIVKNFILEKNINEIYAPYPSVGFLKSKLENLGKSENIRFNFFCNNWELLFWPHAKKGFFKLKKQIKPIIKDLNQMKLNLQ